ncbi:MAG: hypothetical protein IJQ59_10070, partial [Bacteroidaceae bacterium]|nr:hypothetical protein [Bacteroidaceae bacterium]
LHESDATAELHNDYTLPFPEIPEGYDAVYKLEFENDVLLSAAVTAGENGKVALYREDFNGEGGPMAHNAYVGPQVGEGEGGTGSAPFMAQIGEGTSTMGYLPMYAFYNYSISEQLFLASELEEAGVTSAPMASLSWYATSVVSSAQNNISIWMANVSDTEMTTTSHLTAGMTLVYTGNFTPAVGWNEFVLNGSSFAWDGTSNILICVQRNNGSYQSGMNWQTHNAGFNASDYRYNDGSAYDMATTQYDTYTTTSRANIIMRSAGRGNRDGLATLTLHDGTENNGFIPMYGGYFDDFTKSECVFPADELTAMTGSTITSMKFYVNNTGTLRDWTGSQQQVFLKEVPSATLNEYSGLDGATIVYEGSLTAPTASDDEMEINFTTPYHYNGGNLLVGVYNITDGNYQFVYFTGETVNGASGAGSNGNSLDGVLFNQRNFLPKTTFTYTSGGDEPNPGYEPAPEIVDMPVRAGRYYLVASSTDMDFEVTINATDMPCPELAYSPVPFDGETQVEPGTV